MLPPTISRRRWKRALRDTSSYTGADAYRFLLQLACGLESEIAGETEILGQIKQSLARLRSRACREARGAAALDAAPAAGYERDPQRVCGGPGQRNLWLAGAPPAGRHVAPAPLCCWARASWPKPSCPSWTRAKCWCGTAAANAREAMLSRQRAAQTHGRVMLLSTPLRGGSCRLAPRARCGDLHSRGCRSAMPRACAAWRARVARHDGRVLHLGIDSAAGHRVAAASRTLPRCSDLFGLRDTQAGQRDAAAGPRPQGLRRQGAAGPARRCRRLARRQFESWLGRSGCLPGFQLLIHPMTEPDTASGDASLRAGVGAEQPGCRRTARRASRPRSGTGGHRDARRRGARRAAVEHGGQGILHRRDRSRAARRPRRFHRAFAEGPEPRAAARSSCWPRCRARANPRDIAHLCAPMCRSAWPTGAGLRIGTSSPRRAELLPPFFAQALPHARAQHARTLENLRGNVDSRLRRLHEPRGSERHLDGIVLALAGLSRLYRRHQPPNAQGAAAAAMDCCRACPSWCCR